MGQARAGPSFASSSGFNAGKFKIRLEARSPRRFEHRNPAIYIALPRPIHLLVNSGQAEMQIARGGGTEIKMIRRQSIAKHRD